MRVVKVQSLENYTPSFANSTAKNEANFGEVLDAKANENAKVVNETSQAEYKQISFKQMIELEHKATVAFRQGDLISYERYTNALNGYTQSIQEIANAEEVEQREQNTGRGLFPEDAPQVVKDYAASLSMKERMTMMVSSRVQIIIANAYQDQNGQFHIRRKGEPGYVDIFKQPDFTYTKHAEDMIKYLHFTRKYLSEQQYNEREEILLDFKKAVEGY